MPGLAILFARIFTALGGLRIASWWHRMWVVSFQIFTRIEIISLLSTIFNTVWGGGLLLWADNNPKLAEDAVEKIVKKVTDQTPIAVSLAAGTIEQITGITIDKEKLKTAATGPDRAAYKLELGAEFTQVVSNMLNVNAAKQDFSTRTGYVGSFNNLNAYFGTNLDFQLRSLTIGTISAITGWQSLRHLEGLHQSINWAFGFGWLSWSVLSNAMDVTVNAGVKRYYMALVKPHDLSTGQANKMRIRNHISPEVWGQIHDNAGTNDEARNWQLMLEFNQPSITDLRTAWERDEINESKLDELLREHEYTPDGETLVKNSITKHREWKLADAVTAEHFKFLRHGWETPEETRAWLRSQGWSEREMELALEANRLEQKAKKEHAPPRLTQTQLKLAMKHQLMTADDVFLYLTNQGYSEVDAMIIVIEDEIANLPKLKDCGDPFDPKQLTSVFGRVLSKVTLGNVPASLGKWLACAVTKL